MTNKNVKTTESTTEKVEKKSYEIVEEQFDDFGFENDNTGSQYDEVYFVKPKTKDAAYFEFSKKEGDVIKKDPRTTIATVEGNLVKLELSSYTYENREVKTFKMYITKDVKGRNILFIVSSSYTQVGRSILNSFLGCNEPIERVNISLYKNYSGYASVKMSINGKKSEWKYSVQDQKPMIEVILNKKGEKVSTDYTELDEFLQDKIREHLSVLFPNQQHTKFVEENLEIKNQEEVFGQDDASDFFNLGEEDN